MKYFAALFSLASIIIALLLASCASEDQHTRLPGQYPDFILLPNGWRLTPAGDHAEVGELPLNMVLSTDTRYAVTSNKGAEFLYGGFHPFLNGRLENQSMRHINLSLHPVLIPETFTSL